MSLVCPAGTAGAGALAVRRTALLYVLALSCVLGAAGCGGRAQGVDASSRSDAGGSSVLPGSDSCLSSLGVPCDAFREAYIKASNTGPRDQFGYSLSVSGETMAVGALSESSCGTGIEADQTSNDCDGAGAVYVFRRDQAGAWAQEAFLKPSRVEAGYYFGNALSLSADTLAVAAHSEDRCEDGPEDRISRRCEKAGAVFVFRRTQDGWRQEAYVKASNVEAGDYFGEAVALSGDTLVVSALLENSCATGADGDQTNNDCYYAGAVYVFRRREFQGQGTWVQEAYLKASNTDAADEYDYFDRALSLSGDTLAVGADGEDSCATGVEGDQLDRGCSGAGAVFVFRRAEQTGIVSWTQEAYLKASNTDPRDHFGSALALSEDTLAIGAPGEQSCATGVDRDQSNDDCEAAGAVYVFGREGRAGQASWHQRAYLKASNAEPTDFFGEALSLDAGTLVVGADEEDGCSPDVDGNPANNECVRAGAVYLFGLDGAGWTQRAYIKASRTDGVPGEYFGHSVALLGNSVAIGAPLEDGCAVGVGGDETSNDCAHSGAVFVRRIAP